MTNDVSFLIEPMVEPINPTTLQCAVLENGDDLLGLHEKLLNWLQHADYLHEARNLGKRLQRGCGMNMWLTSLICIFVRVDAELRIRLIHFLESQYH